MEHFEIVRLSRWKPRYEVRAAGAKVGSLERRQSRRAAFADVSGVRWVLTRRGVLRSRYTAITAASETAAIVEGHGHSRSILLADGQRLGFARAGRKQGWELASPDGSVRVVIRTSSGSGAAIELEPGWLSRLDAVLLALLCWFVLVEERDDGSAAVIATMVPAG